MRRRSGRPSARSPSADERRNFVLWERIATEYEIRNARALRRDNGAAWGVWRIPERELRLLDEVRGRDVLELGCGSAGWSIALARRGARVIGLDFSPSRLAQARRRMRRAGVEFPLVEASAEEIPYPSARFDVVLSDYGATTFADPQRVVPEVARVLRPRGILVFAHASPFRTVAEDLRADRLRRRLIHDYFETRVIRPPTDPSVEFQLPYGEWVDLFAGCGLAVERLIEPRAAARARSSYVSLADARWARHWPSEMIWKVRKVPRPAHRTAVH